jgi:hypothetical protein
MVKEHQITNTVAAYHFSEGMRPFSLDLGIKRIWQQVISLYYTIHSLSSRMETSLMFYQWKSRPWH